MTTPRLSMSRPLALLAVCAITALACVLLLPSEIRAGLNALTAAQFSAHTLRIAEIDAQGRIIDISASPGSLTTFLAIVTLSSAVIGVCLVHWFLRTSPMQAAPSTDMMRRVDVSGKRLEEEISSVVALLQSQLKSSDRYAAALANADGQLKSFSTAQQLQRIVEVLIGENAKVKTEISSLRRGLEASRTQIDALREDLREAKELVTIDPLTSLKNRRWMQDSLHGVAGSGTSPQAPFSIVMADIDHFKRINDVFGHRTGDEILKKFGELLQSNVAEPESAVRYGGEEFTLILPGQRKSQAWQRAERIRHELELKQWVEHKTRTNIGKITASFGVAELHDGERIDEVIQRADERLYKAKSAGRNRVVSED